MVHHVYQQRISAAGLCGFCTDELARRLKARGLFHDDRASMDLVWQDRDDGALVAGENIVAVSKDGREDLRG